MSAEYDPHGKVDSSAISEVRTVLSRARTALEGIESGEGPHIVVKHASWDPSLREYVGRVTAPLPDAEEMVAALRQVVVLLSPWENRASRRRGAR